MDALPQFASSSCEFVFRKSSGNHDEKNAFRKSRLNSRPLQKRHRPQTKLRQHSHMPGNIIMIIMQSFAPKEAIREKVTKPHSIAFGGVFPNITEAILVDEISTK